MSDSDNDDIDLVVTQIIMNNIKTTELVKELLANNLLQNEVGEASNETPRGPRKNRVRRTQPKTKRLKRITETKMADKEKTVCDSSSSSRDQSNEEEDLMALLGSESGWVEARTHCDHLDTLSSDLVHIPTPDTPCNRCHHPAENWLCLSCKDVLCSRFINKHMLDHYQQQNHSVALSYSDLSVWCFSCNSYLDAQVMVPLRPVYETAYILKFGEAPPARTVEFLQVDGSTSAN